VIWEFLKEFVYLDFTDRSRALLLGKRIMIKESEEEVVRPPFTSAEKCIRENYSNQHGILCLASLGWNEEDSLKKKCCCSVDQWGNIPFREDRIVLEFSDIAPPGRPVFGLKKFVNLSEEENIVDSCVSKQARESQGLHDHYIKRSYFVQTCGHMIHENCFMFVLFLLYCCYMVILMK
jgi:hypothetical protein